MLPLGTLKLTSRRTTWSSKAKETVSNTTADGTQRGVIRPSPLEMELGRALQRSFGSEPCGPSCPREALVWGESNMPAVLG